MAAAFAAPCPGWAGARHHSADILVAKENGRPGEAPVYRCILGEVHVTDTMVMRQVIRQLHPRPDELVEAFRRDVGPPQIYRVTPTNYQGHRKVWDPFIPGDLQLLRDGSPTWRRGDEVLRLADFVIEDSPEGLVVRSHDKTRRFAATVYFERLLWRESYTGFGLLPPRPHTPRILVDDFVVQREGWRFLCRALDFAREKTEAGRFIAARRWARSYDLPRWIFIRVPQEYKPVYVDFDSPVSVELLAKLVRRAEELVGENALLGVSEMLPTPRQAWLVDAQGALYSSELRIVTVDPEPWSPLAASA